MELGYLPSAAAAQEAAEHTALVRHLLPAGNVVIPVTIEVYAVRTDRRTRSPIWTWRAVDPEEGVVATSGQLWATPRAVFRYLIDLFPAATVRIIEPE